MRVTLIRHGEAGDDAPRDDLRALTLKGRAAVARVARSLRRRGGDFTAIVASPYVRALQTAEIIAAEVGFGGRLTVNEALVPEARVSQAVALLSSLAAEASVASVAFVAHEPILSSLAGELLGRARFAALRKGEALRLRLPAGPGKPGGELRWRIDPDTGDRQTD
jgi:phosphohistidine phosphatase